MWQKVEAATRDLSRCFDEVASGGSLVPPSFASKSWCKPSSVLLGTEEAVNAIYAIADNPDKIIGDGSD